MLNRRVLGEAPLVCRVALRPAGLVLPEAEQSSRWLWQHCPRYGPSTCSRAAQTVPGGWPPCSNWQATRNTWKSKEKGNDTARTDRTHRPKRPHWSAG